MKISPIDKTFLLKVTEKGSVKISTPSPSFKNHAPSNTTITCAVKNTQVPHLRKDEDITEMILLKNQEPNDAYYLQKKIKRLDKISQILFSCKIFGIYSIIHINISKAHTAS